MQQLFLYIFSAPTRWGTRTAAGGFAPDGAAAFSASAERGTRTASAGSPFPGGSLFSAPAEWGTRTALACSPLTGRQLFQHRLSGGHERRQRVRPFRAESFPLRFSGGIRRLRTAGASRHPPRGQKGRTTCGFPSSLNSYLSLGESGADCRHVTAPKRGTAEDFSYRVFRNLFAGSDSVLLHRSESLRRCGITVPHNSLARYY